MFWGLIGVGLTLFLAGVTVLQAADSPFWTFLGWVLLVAGLGTLAAAARKRDASSDGPDSAQGGGIAAGPDGGANKRKGYVGKPGSYGDLSRAQFGEDLDVGIENEGEVDASDADFK